MPTTIISSPDGGKPYTTQDWARDADHERRLRETAVKEWDAMSASERCAYGFSRERYIPARAAQIRTGKSCDEIWYGRPDPRKA